MPSGIGAFSLFGVSFGLEPVFEYLVCSLDSLKALVFV
jgi:hypothetical protein